MAEKKVLKDAAFKTLIYISSLRGGLPTWQSQIQNDASEVFAITTLRSQ
ncbi:MAG: hypothetical protein V4642_05140 [Bacteroidota bacterium]